MNWDDLRFVSAVSRHGSLLAAAKELRVEHTTVGRRIDAAERSLDTKLFARGTAGLVLTVDGERLLEPLQRVEEAVNALERRANAEQVEFQGTVTVTSPESFGVVWLAPRLASFARQHRGLRIALEPSGDVLDLGRRQADIAVRFFRTKQRALVVRRVAEVGHGLYASKSYLARDAVRGSEDLKRHPLLSDNLQSVEARWLSALSSGNTPIFTSTLAVGLAAAAKAGAGIAVLPRYIGDSEPELKHLPMPNEPKDVLWLTVHRDLRSTPRIRAVLDFLINQFDRERAILRGR